MKEREREREEEEREREREEERERKRDMCNGSVRMVSIPPLEGHNDRVWHVCWSKRGDQLASCGGDKTIRLWKPTTDSLMPMQMQKMEQKMEQKKEEQKKEEEKKKENSLSSSSFKWMRDQAQAQACYASHKQQHLVSSYTCVDKLEGSHTKTIRRCEFSRCDSMIASVSFDATTCIWDKKFGKHRHHHHHHYEQQQREEREVEEVDDFDEEDREGERDEQQWELLVTLEGHESEIKDVAWSPDGELLATCGRDKSIWIWLKEIDEEFECLDVLQGHTQDIKAITWIPATRVLVSASYDNTIKVWNEMADEWVCTQTLDSAYQGHEDTVWNLCCSPQGEKIVSCDNSGMILLWRVIPEEDKNLKLDLLSRNKCPNDAPIYSIDWSSDGRLIAIGSSDNSLTLLSLDADDKLQQVVVRKQAHEGDVNCVSWHPTKPHVLASGGDDEKVKVWSVLYDEV